MSGEQQRRGIFRREDESYDNGSGGVMTQQGQSAQPGQEVTVVGAGARLEGNVVSAGSLRVDGQIKGKINADGDVVLSPQSAVEADIEAANVTVAGRFKGDIRAKGRVELANGGRIDGNITSRTLVIQEGGVFCGQSDMGQPVQKPAAQGTQAPTQQQSSSGSQQPAGEAAPTRA
jgi:cytoskeletal protein CcmA (bactofilin family)